jgi:hypothetical protein
MAVLIRTCQCPRFDERCTTDMTQEDLLCGACRGGRCAKRYAGHPAGWKYDTHIDWGGPPPEDDEPSGAQRRMALRAAEMDRLHLEFGEGSWIDAANTGGPLHQVDADGKPFLAYECPFSQTGDPVLMCPCCQRRGGCLAR